MLYQKISSRPFPPQQIYTCTQKHNFSTARETGAADTLSDLNPRMNITVGENKAGHPDLRQDDFSPSPPVTVASPCQCLCYLCVN